MADNTMLMDLMDACLTECEIRKLAPKAIEGYKSCFGLCSFGFQTMNRSNAFPT